MFIRKNRGQTTMEYVIILAAIIGVVVAVAGGAIKTNVTTALTNAANKIGNSLNE